jgi:hypothetical protein
LVYERTKISAKQKPKYLGADMKRLIPAALASALLLALAPGARAGTLLPGQVDFGTFAGPSSGGEFVEVNVTSSLISLAASFVEKDEPDVAQLLKGLQLVHVNVIGMNDDNKADLTARAQKIRKELEEKGWEKVVTAQDRGQDVGIYLKTHSQGNVQGLVVVALDGKKEAVFVNVVGDIKPEQLSTLGDRLHIDPLKKMGHTQQKAHEKAEEN